MRLCRAWGHVVFWAAECPAITLHNMGTRGVLSGRMSGDYFAQNGDTWCFERPSVWHLLCTEWEHVVFWAAECLAITLHRMGTRGVLSGRVSGNYFAQNGNTWCFERPNVWRLLYTAWEHVVFWAAECLAITLIEWGHVMFWAADVWRLLRTAWGHVVFWTADVWWLLCNNSFYQALP